SDELFKYWSTNGNLSIEFKIEAKEEKLKRTIRNNYNQEEVIDVNIVEYILLLDEPGLNLHASAQKDMLRFIEDLSKDYQIIYTTHSPFSIPSNNLERVRTVLETKDGSKISDSIQEKDPNTLFPLQ